MSYPHAEDCRCGRKELPLTREDSWWVDAPEYGNCFWLYLRYNDHPHTLSEIASKMKLSISALAAIERKALAKFRSRSDVIDSSGR